MSEFSLFRNRTDLMLRHCPIINATINHIIRVNLSTDLRSNLPVVFEELWSSKKLWLSSIGAGLLIRLL